MFVIIFVIVVIFTFRAVVELQIIPGETAEQVRDVNQGTRIITSQLVMASLALAAIFSLAEVRGTPPSWLQVISWWLGGWPPF